MKKVLFILIVVFSMASCQKDQVSFFAKYTDVFINSAAKTAVVFQSHLDGTTTRFIADNAKDIKKLSEAIDNKDEKIKVSVLDEKIIEVE